MGDEPLVAGLVAPQFGTGEIENAPIGPPFLGIFWAVGLLEDRPDFVAMGVHIDQPGFGGFLVMGTIDAPVVFDGEIVLEVEEEIIGGHLSPGEEVAGEPIIWATVLVMVSEGVVGENVDEEFAMGVEPTGDFGEEPLVIFHMFEHLDTDNAIEGRGEFEVVHIGGEDGEIFQASEGGLGIDVFLLGARIGHAGDLGRGIFFCHPKGERTPAATEFENADAVGKFGTGAG